MKFPVPWAQARAPKSTHKRPSLSKPTPKRSRWSLRAHPVRRQILIGFGLFVLIALLLTAIWYGSRIPSQQATDIQVIGSVTVPATKVETVVAEVLEGSYFSLVPYRFVPFLPVNKIITSVQQVPRVKDVTVEITDARHVVVAFSEYVPTALWCVKDTDNDCVFIDHTGYAFAESPRLEGGAMIRFVTNEEPKLKQVVADRRFLTTVETFVERLESELGLYVTDVVRHDAVDVSYIVAGGGELRVSDRMNVEQSLANLTSILSNDEFADLRDGTFHYIDLRFGDKVFVSEQEYVDTASSTVATSSSETE